MPVDLIALDEYIFLQINNLPHTAWLDTLFLFFSFYPLVIWIVIGIVVVVLEERKEKLFIVRLVLALGLAGFLASAFLKPIIRRPRPDLSHGPSVVIVEEHPAVLPWNNDFAFPSGHAAVAFAGAYIVTREETQSRHSKKHKPAKRNFLKFVFIGFAVLTAFSRLYLGKHYPLDVIVGGVLGWVVGYVAWRFTDMLNFKR